MRHRKTEWDKVERKERDVITRMALERREVQVEELKYIMREILCW